MKIYGPYKRNTDGRWYIKVIKDDGKRTTMSYPKYLLGIKDDKTADHIDRNIDNNSPSNLRVINRPDHSREDHIYTKSQFLYVHGAIVKL